MKILGIVGGIGAGKTTVVSILTELTPCYIIGADEIGHRILLKGGKAYTPVIQAFGEGILDDEGNIVRARLGSIVFADRSKLDVLNSMTHPLIHEEVQRLIDECKAQKQHEIIVVDAALLIEIGLVKLTDQVLAVYADEATRIERIMKREAFTRLQATERINKQKKWEELEKVAHYVIDNSLSYEQTREQVVALLEKLRVCD